MLNKFMVAALMACGLNSSLLAETAGVKQNYTSEIEEKVIFSAANTGFNMPAGWEGNFVSQQFLVNKLHLIVRIKAGSKIPQLTIDGFGLAATHRVIQGKIIHYTYDLAVFRGRLVKLKIAGNSASINGLKAIVLSDTSAENLPVPEKEKPIEAKKSIEKNEQVNDVESSNERKKFAYRSAAGRRGALATYGGSMAGQASLENSMKWLAQVQNPDGSWGESVKMKNGLSGLVLLTYLARGETPKSKKYGETVNKAIKYLCSQTKFESGHGGSYSQAIKAQALAEAYYMTGNYQVIEPLTIMITDLLDCQGEAGGFDYFYSKGTNFSLQYDNSLSSWAFQAIRIAKATGLEFGKYGDLTAVETKCIKHMKVAGAQGWPYSMGKGGTRSNSGLKGAGAFNLLSFAQKKNGTEVTSLLKELGEKAHKELDWNAPQANKLYAWYHTTNAFFQEGGKNWKIWRKNFQRLLQKQQNPAGYWDYPGAFFGKSGKDIEDKLQATVLCSLMLTSFYRYPEKIAGRTIPLKTGDYQE